MKTTINIFHDQEMFEFTIQNGTPEQGTSIMSIRKFYQGGMIRTIGFASLPKEVKQKLIQKIKRN